MTAARAMIQIDGRWHHLTGRTAAIMAAIVAHAEEIDGPPFLHVVLDCRPRSVKTSITRTYPAVEIATTEHE